VTVLAATGSGDEGSRAEPAEGVGNRIYQRRQTLAESLLATRARYDSWLKQQARARAGLQCGAWTATAPLPLRSAEESRFPETGVDLDAKGTDGKPLWSPHPEWTDTRTPLNLAAETPPVRSVAVYLTRTLTAAEAGPLTIGLGGGDHLAAWLNGQPVVATVTTLGYERYGTSLRPEGHPRQDQVLVDLPLVAGENRLLVRLYQADAGPHSPLLLWSSLAPDPVPDLWAQVRVDFPPAANHVLELVDAEWFTTGGWLAAGERTDLEQALVRGLAAELGGAAEPLRQRLAELTQAQAPPTDPRWLALCVTAAEFAAITRERARLTAAVEDLYRSFPEQYPGRESQARLEKHGVGLFERVATESAQPRGQQPLPAAAELENLRRDLLVTRNPLLEGAELAFVRRYTYDSMHYYDDYYNGVRRFGGNLCVLNLDTGRVRQLVPELEGGIFDRYDLSSDGRRLVFGYRAHRAEGYRLYEIGLDGTGLRQLTFAPPDEAARVTRYSLYPVDALKSNPALYGHWTDDLHPCYLPDGGVAFVSTRQ
jgi:hypothetical protein